MLKRTGGQPFLLLLAAGAFSALVSTTLPNVNAIVLILPAMERVCQQLRLDPVPYVLVATFMTNIGGAMTMIGDAPNLMVAATFDLTFDEFLYNVAPCVLIAMPFQAGLAGCVCALHAGDVRAAGRGRSLRSSTTASDHLSAVRVRLPLTLRSTSLPTLRLASR